MKRTRIVWLVLALLMVGTLIWAGGGKEAASDDSGAVVLRYTSLRTEDQERENSKNAEFTKLFPNIKIQFEAIKDTEYDTVLKTSLETGVAADIVMLRSFDGGRQIYDGGYLVELNDIIPGMHDTFTANSIATWATEDGVMYGVPYFGSITGVWYNIDIFNKYGLKEPETWAEFIAICEKLKNAGETVFAHGTKDQWAITETLYCDLGPNFYGGEDSRQKLMAKEIKYTDPKFVKAYEKIGELVKYFPSGYQGIDYVTMQQMFLNEQAAMFIAGSWELGIIRDAEVNAGWFPPPVEKKGDPLHYAFYADLALGINKNTEHMEEAIEFLKWVASPDHAKLLANALPGMFPTLKIHYDIDDALALEIIESTQMSHVVPTGQLMWEKLSLEEPSGETLQNEAVQRFLNGTFTAKQAVEYVQKGLDTWYFK
ncbi:MAG: ABC transporter substrate-binding protein [Sphaerochaetaceae bacterium]|nr:ABC transporter substrate-binding protein [Sphaerochaetaceae bacterium]NLO61483.1 carbohydrate ABC transporter substrate-binding protein [Spirochaetales bacterium]MDD2405002.1 ABC transporter substrate-binding protein [Sphaerochaetaceae bacterium]MDD3670878.1 ABC transporter substrate-binding protein [Sphaerochaetaceae bacterium]MDD4260279.1 ABC transporter substrate-binding protein [Sphaerochaetaceae bacterium]